MPVGVQAAIDGKTAYVAFADIPQVAAFDMEALRLRYIPATINGVGVYSVGLSNQVCH